MLEKKEICFFGMAISGSLAMVISVLAVVGGADIQIAGPFFLGGASIGVGGCCGLSSVKNRNTYFEARTTGYENKKSNRNNTQKQKNAVPKLEIPAATTEMITLGTIYEEPEEEEKAVTEFEELEKGLAQDRLALVSSDDSADDSTPSDGLKAKSLKNFKKK